ncbi:MAG: response regulator [Nitrospinae bacterium]|nr:response regulator [Nitrospinota bacterium]
MTRILVVDDEVETCDLLKRYLTKKGYQTFTALSGEDAVNIVKEERPHIVLLDIRMPGMGGIEALKKIKEIDREIGVVMITAVKEEETAKEILKLGADDYITKPMDLKYLDNVLMVKIAMMTG